MAGALKAAPQCFDPQIDRVGLVCVRGHACRRRKNPPRPAPAAGPRAPWPASLRRRASRSLPVGQGREIPPAGLRAWSARPPRLETGKASMPPQAPVLVLLDDRIGRASSSGSASMKAGGLRRPGRPAGRGRQRSGPPRSPGVMASAGPFPQGLSAGSSGLDGGGAARRPDRGQVRSPSSMSPPTDG